MTASPLCLPSRLPQLWGAACTSCVTLGKLPPQALVWGNNIYFYKVMRLNGIKIAFIFTCFSVEFLFMHGNWPGPPSPGGPCRHDLYSNIFSTVDSSLPLQKETFPNKQQEGE